MCVNGVIAAFDQDLTGKMRERFKDFHQFVFAHGADWNGKHTITPFPRKKSLESVDYCYNSNMILSNNQ